MLSAGGAVAGALLAIAAVRGLARARARVSAAARPDGRRRPRARVHRRVAVADQPRASAWCPRWRGGAAGAQQTLAVDSRGSVGGRSRRAIAPGRRRSRARAGAARRRRPHAPHRGRDLTHASPGFNRADRCCRCSSRSSARPTPRIRPSSAFQDRLLERLRAIPGVESAALAGQIPFGGNYDCRGFHANGRMKPNTADDPCIERYGITPGYRGLMGIPLLAGPRPSRTPTRRRRSPCS